LGENVSTIKINRETLSEASRDVGNEVNTEKTRYVVVSRHQNRSLLIANIPIENAAKFKYLKTTARIRIAPRRN